MCAQSSVARTASAGKAFRYSNVRAVRAGCDRAARTRSRLNAPAVLAVRDQLRMMLSSRPTGSRPTGEGARRAGPRVREARFVSEESWRRAVRGIVRVVRVRWVRKVWVGEVAGWR